ncbi:MAG: DUF805 domain-containing protein [Pseudomonadota bacterium]
MISAVRTCFRKYITFSGRAPRSEFWYFILFLFLAFLVLGALDLFLFGEWNALTNQYESGGVIPGLFFLACLLPWLAVTWRRMHDSGLGGYWPFVVWILSSILTGMFIFMAASIATNTTGDAALASLIPLVLGGVSGFAVHPINIYLLCRRSTPGMNAYGPHPDHDPGMAMEDVFE